MKLCFTSATAGARIQRARVAKEKWLVIGIKEIQIIQGKEPRIGENKILRGFKNIARKTESTII